MVHSKKSQNSNNFYRTTPLTFSRIQKCIACANILFVEQRVTSLNNFHPRGKAQGKTTIYVHKNTVYHKGTHLSDLRIQAATAIFNLYISLEKLMTFCCLSNHLIIDINFFNFFTKLRERWTVRSNSIFLDERLNHKTHVKKSLELNIRQRKLY